MPLEAPVTTAVRPAPGAPAGTEGDWAEGPGMRPILALLQTAMSSGCLPAPWERGGRSHVAARRRPRSAVPRRVATLSVHTSPLDQPGAGDAGGMNVYVVEVSRRLAGRGIAVDVFTRATSSELPPVVEMSAGVTVRHVSAGPFEGLGKQELPAQMCAFTAAVLREEAQHEPGYYDVVHSHYWLSRSEEHTSELQSRQYLVCRLLLEQ